MCTLAQTVPNVNANTNVRDNSTDFIGELHILCSHGSASALPTVEQGQASSRIISHAPTLQNTLNTGQHTHTRATRCEAMTKCG